MCYIDFLIFVFFIFSDSTSQISVMSGLAASLPCSLKSSVPDDKVRLVLWFKDAEEKPIYTLDARGDYDLN